MNYQLSSKWIIFKNQTGTYLIPKKLIKHFFSSKGKITEWTSRQPTEFRKRAPIGLHGTKNLNITVSLFWEIPPIYGLKNKTTPTCLLVPSYLKHNKQIRHFSNKKNVVKKEKKSLKEKIKDELRHYYHGFKLLNLNVKVSRKLVYRTLKGENLTRRERKLVRRFYSQISNLNPTSLHSHRYLSQLYFSSQEL